MTTETPEPQQTVTPEQQLRRIAYAAIQANPRAVYSETRDPYTYAADFLRAHPDLLPAHITAVVAEDEERIRSRSEASQARQAWVKELGISDEQAARILASAYLVENDVAGVPLHRLLGVLPKGGQ